MNALLTLFWNAEESRLRAFYRISLVFPAYFLITQILWLSLSYFTHFTMDFTGSIPLWCIVILVFSKSMRIGLIWIASLYLDKRAFSDFGMTFNKEWWVDLAFGLLLGILSMTGIFLIELWMGWVSISELFHVFVADRSFWITISLFFVLFSAVGFAEELFYRSYILTNAAEGLNVNNRPTRAIISALLLSSILFGLTHAFNANATLISTFNIMFGGVWLAIGYLLTGRLAISIGLHIAWNFCQGNIFGFAISGHTFAREAVSMITIEQAGPALWTGGSFGPEAGIIGFLAMLVCTILTVIWVYFRTGSIKLYLPLAKQTVRKPAQTTLDSTHPSCI
jgi:membrane protease YdiL (CAAX protease family)